jgi:hypothetical protein
MSSNKTKIKTVMKRFKELLQGSPEEGENCEKRSVADKHHQRRSIISYINVIWVYQVSINTCKILQICLNFFSFENYIFAHVFL